MAQKAIVEEGDTEAFAVPLQTPGLAGCDRPQDEHFGSSFDLTLLVSMYVRFTYATRRLTSTKRVRAFCCEQYRLSAVALYSST